MKPNSLGRTLLVCSLALAGCGGDACKPDTVQIKLHFDAVSAAADSMELDATYAGKSTSQPVTHRAGASDGAIELDLPGYVAGSTLDVIVVAEVAGKPIGSASVHGLTLDKSCTQLALDVEADLVPPDMLPGPPPDMLPGPPPDMLPGPPPDMLPGLPPDMLPGPPADMAGYGPPVTLAATATQKLDILFMIDNSPSMNAMQAQLQAQFAKFLQPFVDLAAAGFYADLHIGVITSDYGAGDTPGGGCQASPGGQLGRLQALGVAAPAGCVPPTGTPYISYQFGANGDVSNLPGTTSPAQLGTTFSCMAAVGAAGCGFEHQLESTLAALRNQTDNAGFLRADAVLAVVFFTNEDDGSAAPNAVFYRSTADPNVYGAYDTYRQTHFGVECLQAGALAPTPEAASNALLDGCQGIPNGLTPTPSTELEYDLSRYTGLFTAPLAQGGLKSDPGNIVLVAIDAPDAPFQTRLVLPSTGLGVPPNPTYQPCDMVSATCAVRVDHSCQNTAAPQFFGDPAVRLNSVVGSARYNQQFSICGDDPSTAPDYSKTLTATGNLLRTRLAGNCMTTPLANPAAPDCTVIAVGADPTKAMVIPRCDSGAKSCWSAIKEPYCSGISPDGVAIQLSSDVVIPVGWALSASCRTP